MLGVDDGTKRRVQMEVLVYASLLVVQYVARSNGYDFCTCSSHAYVENVVMVL